VSLVSLIDPDRCRCTESDDALSIDIAASSGAKTIDPLPYLCNAAECPTLAEDGLPLYCDASHLDPVTFVLTLPSWMISFWLKTLPPLWISPRYPGTHYR